jgi:hypothetical protein
VSAPNGSCATIAIHIFTLRLPSRFSEPQVSTPIGNTSSPYFFIVSDRPFLRPINIPSLNGGGRQLDLLREEYAWAF